MTFDCSRLSEYNIKENLPRDGMKNQDAWKVSGISKKFPTYRNKPFVSIQSWLNGKRQDDEAEGLWRIHDTLYDFTDFVERHPGGSFWIKETKGTDITESFESHHISLMPEKMLKKFEIRHAQMPRNYTLTLNKNGFYMTLKSRVREVYKELDLRPSKRSDLFHTCLLASTIFNAVLSALSGWLIFCLIAGISLALLTVVSHNYFHKKDNWRMYAFNLSLMNFTSWRVSHALSHHVYPNTLNDLEMSLFEPFLCWVPNPYIASKLRRSISLLTQPIFYMGMFPFEMVMRIVNSLRYGNVLRWHDLIGFTLLFLMFAVSYESCVTVLGQWLLIITLGSFIFGSIGLNAAHHDPKIYHDGDAPRKDKDWGLFQIDTIIDRNDIKGSHFLVLATFGEHILHHLFPTLDHGVLPQLYPVFYKTLQEFCVDIRECTQVDHIIGQNKQLLRTEPNPIPPGSKKNI